MYHITSCPGHEENQPKQVGQADPFWVEHGELTEATTIDLIHSLLISYSSYVSLPLSSKSAQALLVVPSTIFLQEDEGNWQRKSKKLTP